MPQSIDPCPANRSPGQIGQPGQNPDPSEVELWLEERPEVRSALPYADGSQPVQIIALGNVQNDGFFTNSGVTLAGTANQSIGTGDHFEAPVTLE
ncbi:MAG: hypothetical protein GY780_03810 [bacterium]|nr:hypothetical protein [bacterium]